MRPWEAELQDRIAEAGRMRTAFESKFQNYGYPHKELATLAFDISEFHDACRAYLIQIQKLVTDPTVDPDLVGAELSKLEALLEDASGHLNDLRESLEKFNRFLSDLEDKGS